MWGRWHGLVLPLFSNGMTKAGHKSTSGVIPLIGFAIEKLSKSKTLQVSRTKIINLKKNWCFECSMTWNTTLYKPIFALVLQYICRQATNQSQFNKYFTYFINSTDINWQFVIVLSALPHIVSHIAFIAVALVIPKNGWKGKGKGFATGPFKLQGLKWSLICGQWGNEQGWWENSIMQQRWE